MNGTSSSQEPETNDASSPRSRWYYIYTNCAWIETIDDKTIMLTFFYHSVERRIPESSQEDQFETVNFLPLSTILSFWDVRLLVMVIICRPIRIFQFYYQLNSTPLNRWHNTFHINTGKDSRRFPGRPPISALFSSFSSSSCSPFCAMAIRPSVSQVHSKLILP